MIVYEPCVFSLESSGIRNMRTDKKNIRTVYDGGPGGATDRMGTGRRWMPLLASKTAQPGSRLESV